MMQAGRRSEEVHLYILDASVQEVRQLAENENAVRLPYGVSDYVMLKEKKFLYVDKTQYIEKLEHDKPYITFLRPRRFGKSLFVSTLEAYYDIRFGNQFEKLFGDTYIGRNPTSEHNQYSVLKFNFSGIDSDDMDSLRSDMYDSVAAQLGDFLEAHGLDKEVTLQLAEKSEKKLPSALLRTFLFSVKKHVRNHPLYILIDEYDHFANRVLGSRITDFEKIVSRNGFVHTFYENIKNATGDGVVQRIFLTGVSPVTLDSMTSGFSITKTITRNPIYHKMMGFSDAESKGLIEQLFPEMPLFEKETILKTLKTYYDGYRFSEDAAETLFNSDMVLYYLDELQQRGIPPRELLDINIASDYGNLENMFSVYITSASKSKDAAATLDMVMEARYKTLVDLLTEKSITVQMTSQYSLKKFDLDDFKSLLFYMGYATIESYIDGITSMRIPNYVISKLFADCFYAIGHTETDDGWIERMRDAFQLIAREGDISLFVELLSEDLSKLSNRIYQNFDEKYIQVIAYQQAMRYPTFVAVIEREHVGGYSDLLLLERTPGSVRWNVLLELKYIPQKDMKRKKEKRDAIIAEKRAEALAQISRYLQDPQLAELNRLGRLKKFILIFSKDKCVLKEEVIS